MSGRNSKLRYALDKHKGRNVNLEKQRKHEKEVAKRKRRDPQTEVNVQSTNGMIPHGTHTRKGKGVGKDEIAALISGAGAQSSDEEDVEGLDEEDEESLDADELEEFDDEGAPVSDPKRSDQANSILAAEAAVAASVDGEDVDGDADEEDEQEDVPFSDLSDVSDSQDITTHQKLTKNNIPALQKALKSIQLPFSALPFSSHQSITSAEPTSIPDINDDIRREEALYAQSYDAVIRARALLLAEGAPFTRPNDYFAEMVKTDEHMGKVKGRLVEDAAGRKASEEAKRQRQLKKYSKQVQQERLKERAKAKRETLDKVSALKRKRRDTGGIGGEGQGEDDLFDVAVEDAAEDERAKKRIKKDSRSKGVPNKKRQAKDSKFGFGGKKRYSKSNDAMSAGDTRGFSVKRMKGGASGKGKGAKRLGKSRRPKAF